MGKRFVLRSSSRGRCESWACAKLCVHRKVVGLFSSGSALAVGLHRAAGNLFQRSDADRTCRLSPAFLHMRYWLVGEHVRTCGRSTADLGVVSNTTRLSLNHNSTSWRYTHLQPSQVPHALSIRYGTRQLSVLERSRRKCVRVRGYTGTHVLSWYKHYVQHATWLCHVLRHPRCTALLGPKSTMDVARL
ncbi:hypothetical protein CC86DRAFT_161646 [Ophiobolus disseminans]|uniref:Uncharacterized protein n=1 Tax=Ophiobolus disseminans TaxID=1469910 RepID=A0A6A7ACP9_9PLEO|nr:hypothetical protein CC86DRAFT_161646 [Ophiobolus disseminans]